jgi:hypothetical protein
MIYSNEIILRANTTSSRRILLDNSSTFPIDGDIWEIFVEILDDIRCLDQIQQQVIKSCEEEKDKESTRLCLIFENVPALKKAKTILIHSTLPLQLEIPIKKSGKSYLYESYVSIGCPGVYQIK